jgi:hypothetical protein
LGISGHDADRFILSFSEVFKVGLDRFNIDDNFESEAGSFFFRRRERNALTVGRLETAVEEGYLL